MLPRFPALAAFAAVLLLAVPARADKLQSLLDKYLEKEEIYGGVLLVSDAKGRRLVVSGVSDRKKETPVSADTRFYIASIGKMAVAAATLQLVEDGKLSLDAKVSHAATGVPGIDQLPNARKTTLRHLLDHSSGIPEYMTDAFTADSRKDYKRRWRPAEALRYALDEEASDKPGKSYEYCNTNYLLLGEIIAAADGTTMDEVLQRRIIDRAGMADTSVGAKPGEPRLARGYSVLDEDEDEKDVSLLAWNFPFGDGPLVTTAGDLEKFMFALFRDHRLLKPATVARMTAPSELEEDYGLGVERGKDKCGRWVGHTGSVDGFEAEARYYPERRTVLLYMVNGDAQSETSLLDKTAKVVCKGD